MSDSSARIVILGAGPIGIETALYARYLGFRVELLERGDSAAANVLKWGHVQLFTPFRMNATSLGVAAIQAQDALWESPATDELLTGVTYQQRYLRPLAETDLLADVLQLDTKVLAVGREGWLKSEGVGDPRRAEAPFHILCRDADGKERIHEAEVVIDCTGTYGNHNWLGQGGIPAPGERAAAEQIEYGLPDATGGDEQRYLDRHTLVIGAGYSAATTITQLARLSRDHPGSRTRATWITRSSCDSSPIRRIVEDQLSSRDKLAVEANRIAAESEGFLSHFADTSVASIQYREASDDFEVLLNGLHSGITTFDRIVANVGYRPDNQIYAELQVHECYASNGPMKLAAELMAQRSPGIAIDCLDQKSCGPQSLINPEPNFYILGSKSYGRGSQFLLSIGFEQIRDLFSIVAERDDLDLYATMPPFKA